MTTWLCPPLIAAHCPVCARPFAPHWSYPHLDVWDARVRRYVEGTRVTTTNRPRQYCSRACQQRARNQHGREVRAHDRRWATITGLLKAEAAGQLAIPGAAAFPEPPPRPTRQAS